MRQEFAKALVILESCQEFSALIPEVRANLVFAREKAKTPQDVLAVDGRITIVEDMPKAAGQPKFGASSHLARLIIEILKHNPQYRSAINFRYSPEILKLLPDAVMIDREKEPAESKTKEGKTMAWRVNEAIKLNKDRVPRVICDQGAVGKEPMCVLVGQDPVEVVKQACEIAKGVKK